MAGLHRTKVRHDWGSSQRFITETAIIVFIYSVTMILEKKIIISRRELTFWLQKSIKYKYKAIITAPIVCIVWLFKMCV